MTEFTQIPKVLPPRSLLKYEQKIPKIIWQTMKTSTVPVSLKNYTDTWIGQNPEYEYRFYDDADIIEFIKNDFPEYLEGYKKLKFGASKADLWRYLIIYKYGGVYVDIDCVCINPLRKWINPGSVFVTQLGINKDLCQWMIISTPLNPIFLKAAQKTLHNIEYNNTKAAHYGFKLNSNELGICNNSSLVYFDNEVLGVSGPPVLQQVAEECLADGLLSGILPFTQIVCVSGAEVSCQMNGNVTHGYGGNKNYKRALRLLKIRHYNGFIPRTKRKFIKLFKRI